MREIKFRGKHDGQWVYGNLVKTPYGLYIIPQNLISNSLPQFSIDSKTVGQDTGLKDKNGREIYEGDIAVSFKKQYEHCPTTNKVQFIKGCWRLKAGSINDVPLYNYDESELEVIGNIYENPELLEV